MAANCFVAPRVMDGSTGITVIEVRVAGVTVRVVEPEMLPDVAVIIVAPAATDLAFPFEPAVLLMVVTDSAEELHITDIVMSFVLLSE